MFYSKKTNGFYNPAIHGRNIPTDAIEISDSEHATLIDGQSLGKRIAADAEGRPNLIEQPEPTTQQLAFAARARRNKLIAETDYMLISDYRMAADRLEEVMAYREALRDITSQPGFPDAIEWPRLNAR